MFIVCVGDCFEGETIYGPFESAKAGEAWATAEFVDGENWEAVEVNDPKAGKAVHEEFVRERERSHQERRALAMRKEPR